MPLGKKRGITKCRQQDVQEAKRPRVRCFELRQDSVTGIPINLHQCSTRIHDNTTLEWIHPYVAEQLDWPITHVELTAGDVCVRYIRLLRDQSKTFMMDLNVSEDPLIIVAKKLECPQSFGNEEDFAQCLCDFGGCCCYCMVPGENVCSGCGNTGDCRAGNCGHLCCERVQKYGLGFTWQVWPPQRHFTAHCPKAGCRTWWADPAWVDVYGTPCRVQAWWAAGGLIAASKGMGMIPARAWG